MNKQEREHLKKVAALRCIICFDPACAHHHTGAGMALKASHYETLPLCNHHHTGAQGIHQIGVKEWEAKYGTQDELIKRTKIMLSI